LNFLERIFAQLVNCSEQVVLEELYTSESICATAGQLLQRISAARAWLAAAGLRKGDRCVLLAPNSIAWVGLNLAAMADGIIVVPLYTRQATPELAAMVRDAQPRLICCGDASLRDAIHATWSDGSPAVLLDELFAAPYMGNAPGPARLGKDDPVTIIYTSGTSGEPKGVLLTVDNVTHILSCTSNGFDGAALPAGSRISLPALLLCQFLDSATHVPLPDESFVSFDRSHAAH
jgi:long-subunit acyl-CoA synthetase (AMP-forming)